MKRWEGYFQELLEMNGIRSEKQLKQTINYPKKHTRYEGNMEEFFSNLFSVIISLNPIGKSTVWPFQDNRIARLGFLSLT